MVTHFFSNVNKRSILFEHLLQNQSKAHFGIFYAVVAKKIRIDDVKSRVILSGLSSIKILYLL